MTTTTITSFFVVDIGWTRCLDSRLFFIQGYCPSILVGVLCLIDMFQYQKVSMTGCLYQHQPLYGVFHQSTNIREVVMFLVRLKDPLNLSLFPINHQSLYRVYWVNCFTSTNWIELFLVKLVLSTLHYFHLIINHFIVCTGHAIKRMERREWHQKFLINCCIFNFYFWILTLVITIIRSYIWHILTSVLPSWHGLDPN